MYVILFRVSLCSVDLKINCDVLGVPEWDMREYQNYGIRLDGRRFYLLRFSHDVDGVVTEGGRVPAFTTREAACSFARNQGWTLVASEPGREPPLLRLDRVAGWLERPRKTIDVRLFLESWNLLVDVAHSVGAGENLVAERFNQKVDGDVYDKLFWGNNFPAVTPEGRWYQPIWTGAEVLELRDIFQGGLTLLRQVLQFSPSSEGDTR